MTADSGILNDSTKSSSTYTTSPRSLVPVILGFGAVCLATQSLVLRELMVAFYGTELALAAALSSWLLFIPLGALAGGVAVRFSRSPLKLTLCALYVLAIVVVVQFFCARCVRPLLGFETGSFVSLVWMLPAAALVAGPAGFMVGFVFPPACAHQEELAGRSGAGVSGIYIAEAVGSCVCGALFSFVLLRWQSPAALILLMAAWFLVLVGWWTAREGRAAVLLLLAPILWAALSPLGLTGSVLFGGFLGLLAVFGLWHLVRQGPPLRRWAGVSLGLGFLLAHVFMAAGGLLRLQSLQWRWGTFSNFGFVESRETQYQNLALGRREELRVVLQNGLIGAQFPDERVSAREAALLLTQHPGPRKVLVVGGGLGGLCQQMLEAPVNRVDYVEMDPALLDLVWRHLPSRLRTALERPELMPYACDGRYFVQAAVQNPEGLAGAVYAPWRSAAERSPAAPYDLVVVNVGDPASASANRFYTAEFFQLVERALADGGTLAVCGITGSDNYLRGDVLDYTACVDKTLREVFPHVVVRPGDELWFFASESEGSVTPDPEVLAARFEELGLQPEAMKFMFEMSQFPAGRVEYVRESLAEDRPRVPINRDVHPVGFTYFLRVQEHYAGSARPGEESGGVGLLDRVFSLRPVWFLLPFGAFLLLLGVLRGWPGRDRAAPWFAGFAIFTGGLFGISSEVLIIYGYQTQLGFVYRDISILVGVFMLGLAGGASLMNRAVGGRPVRWLLGLEALQAGLLLLLPWLVGLIGGVSWLYMVLGAAAGFLTGSEFPVACRIGLGAGGRSGTVASLFDACDHGGAVVGAATTGLILMPLLGLSDSAALLACIKATSLLGVLIHCTAPSRGSGPGAGSP